MENKGKEYIFHYILYDYFMQGRTLIVTDIGGEQVQQLVVYQDGALIQDASQLAPSQLTTTTLVSQASSDQLIYQDGRLIDGNGQIIEQTGQQLRRQAAVATENQLINESETGSSMAVQPATSANVDTAVNS